LVLEPENGEVWRRFEQMRRRRKGLPQGSNKELNGKRMQLEDICSLVLRPLAK
jgi:hypothetical protein